MSTERLRDEMAGARELVAEEIAQAIDQQRAHCDECNAPLDLTGVGDIARQHAKGDHDG